MKPFSDSFLEMDQHIKENLYSITGDELYQIKSDFYSAVKHLSGSTENLTGITELLIYRFMYHALGMKNEIDPTGKVTQGLSGSLFIGKRYIGKNKKFQVPDIVLEQSNKIKCLISIKNLLNTVTPTPNEKQSQLVKELRQQNNSIYSSAIQDIFRIENLRHSVHKEFMSVTVVFLQVPPRHQRAIDVIHTNFKWHRFIILEGNHESFYDLIRKRLQF